MSVKALFASQYRQVAPMGDWDLMDPSATE